MTVDFQLSLLSYFVQSPEGGRYISELDDSLFDLEEDKLTFQILQKYYKLYQAVPSRTVAEQFMQELIDQTPNISKDTVANLKANFQDVYIPLPEGDKQKIEDNIILEIQEKQTEKTFLDYAAGKSSINQVFTKMNKLASLVKSAGSADHEDGGFLVQDRYKHFDEQVEGNPTFLHGLNALTAAGGFYSPQLIIFMSSPKAFKTGLLIKLAVEYARDGYKCYYADFENGAKSIRNRAKQCIMECTYQELYSGDLQEELDSVLAMFGKMMGGDLYIDSYAANTKSVTDVKNRLSILKEKFGWEPDIIFYDSIDHMIPSKAEDQKRDVRIKLQLVYHETISLNRELNTFAFAPSQVNRDAVNKKTFDLRDFSEDFGKAMNSHAVFGLCSSPEEQEQGIRRIVPIVQREGKAFKGVNFCVIKIDEECGKVEEVDRDFYDKNIKDE